MEKTLGGEISPDVRSGFFVCFEGLDGAGKTTIARAVVSMLTARGTSAKLVERKDPECGPVNLTRRMQLLKELIWEYGDVPISELGDYHALYNMASWFSAMDFCKIKPLLAAGFIVVVDNWYFKFLSRFTLKQTMNEEHLRACFAHLSRPDLVVYLNIEPETALARKTQLGKGETGFFDGHGPPTPGNFLRYQNKVRQVLDRLAREEGWYPIVVDSKPPEEITARVVDLIGEETSL